jgi:hypothetical protein
MWKLAKSAALALLAVTTMTACDMQEGGALVDPGEPLYDHTMDHTFSSDTARVFAQIERHGNPLSMEVFVPKREHTAYDAFPPTRDPGHFTDDYVHLVSGVFGRPQSLALTLANVLLGTNTWPGDMIKFYPNRASGVTAMNAADAGNVGWLTYVVLPGEGAGGRKLANDDVVDKGLSATFGVLVSDVDPLPMGLRTDNVDRNDATPLNTFPYFPDFHQAPRPQ